MAIPSSQRTAQAADGEFAPRRRLFDASLLFILAIAAASGAAVWWTRGAARFWELLARDAGFAVLLLPKILAGVLIAACLPLLLSRARILTLVGPESGARGLGIATVAGAAVPGGPGVTFPLTVGLMTAGADIGAGIAMVSGWVLLGLNRTLIWELSFLPFDFVALRYGLSCLAPVAFGLIVRRALRRVASAE